MNSGETQKSLTAPVVDKTVQLTNIYSQETISIQLKSDTEKIIAAKIDGNIDFTRSLVEEFEKNTWEFGLSLLHEKKTPYPYHLQLVYVQTIEKLVGNSLEVPERAQFLRTILMELERIDAHLNNLQILVNSISYPILYSQISYIRIKTKKIINEFFKQEKNKTIFVGGIQSNFNNNNAKKIAYLALDLQELTDKIRKKLSRNAIIKEQLGDVGFLSRVTAKKLSLVGPLARSSGITDDVRKSDSYAAYSNTFFTIPVYDSCDLFGEVMVRIEEVIESFSIVEQLLDGLPNGSTFRNIDELEIPAKNVVSRIETPSGEMFCFAISKSGSMKTIPRVYRITSPIKINSQGILARLSGEALENLSLILASIGEGWIVKQN
ncbi:MAG: hypothetical protein ACTSSH_01700 [Candidatus Heimdallarchaeota archaeon]